MDGSADKEEDMIGIPHLVVDVADRTRPASAKVMDTGRLPTVEEVGTTILKLSSVGKIYNRRHIVIFFLFFPENRF